MNIKTRFAPSPTGHMHFGNLRTALFNYLYAKARGGRFLLRVEDTDPERSKTEFAQALFEDLDWSGVVADEGPFYQSKRDALYQDYYQKLIDKGVAYPCFCSDETLKRTRKLQMSQGQPPRYPGTCRSLSPAEIEKKLNQGQKAVLRFKIDRNESIEFTDLIKGQQRFRGADIGDFVIRRSDKTASFMFANAIDDALMDVTHAFRGEDHLTNTPRQLWILKALNLRQPTYGHFPMILGEDGAPLSKRNGSCSVRELKEAGFLAEAINNYLARLGHRYENNTLMTLGELAKEFSLDKVASSAARYDHNTLNFWQKEAIINLSNDDFWEYIKEEVKMLVPEDKRTLFAQTISQNILFKQEAIQWANCFFDGFEIKEPEIVQSAGADFFQACIEGYSENYTDFIESVKEKTGCKGKKLFMPVRVALTGQKSGPELPKIMQLLGREMVIQRLKEAKQYI